METKEKLYISLLEESFPGIKANIIRCETIGFLWEACKLFTKEVNGKALSHVALLECPMLVDGEWHKIGALHGICTQTDTRGHGLATELIKEALHWSQGRCDTVLLFTEIPAFYERLSFQQIQEHRFHLRRSCPKGSQSLKPVIAPQDNDLFLRCFRKREPVSNRLWVKDNGLIASFNTLFATYPTYWSVHYRGRPNVRVTSRHLGLARVLRSHALHFVSFCDTLMKLWVSHRVQACRVFFC